MVECAASLMGSAGLVTRNCASELDTPVTDALRRLLFVNATVMAALFVFTVTEPKLSEVGATPTAASAGLAIARAPAKNNPKDRHTNRVLFMIR